MFTWILIAAGVLLLAGIAWTAFGKGGKAVDHENVRQGRLGDAGKGDYNGGVGL